MGSEWFETVLANMNTYGRVSVCGAISQYNLKEPATGNKAASCEQLIVHVAKLCVSLFCVCVHVCVCLCIAKIRCLGVGEGVGEWGSGGVEGFGRSEQ